MTSIQSLHKNNLSKMICHVMLQETQVIKRQKVEQEARHGKLKVNRVDAQWSPAVGGKQ